MLGFWVCLPVIAGLACVLLIELRKARKMEREVKMLKPLVAADPMTGLLNRRGLTEHATRLLSRAIRQGDRRVCAVYVDVNWLKYVNDTHGHDAGDRYILAVRDVLLECFKRPDDIVARVGGDEFVVLFPCKDGEDAARALVHFYVLTSSRAISVGEGTVVLSVAVGGSILTVRSKPPSSPSIPRLAAHTPSNPIMAKLVIATPPTIHVNGGREARSKDGAAAIHELLTRHLALADSYMNRAKQEGKDGNPQVILDGVLVSLS